MSGKGPPPRFRIRLEDGSEVPVSSIEALARRISRGDVFPATPLFDAGTGTWTRSEESHAVRFILEQLREDGEETPGAWRPRDPEGSEGEAASAHEGAVPVELPADSPPAGDSVPGSQAAGDPMSTEPRPPPGPVDSGPAGRGPLDFGLTLADLPEDEFDGPTVSGDDRGPQRGTGDGHDTGPSGPPVDDWFPPTASGGPGVGDGATSPGTLEVEARGVEWPWEAPPPAPADATPSPAGRDTRGRRVGILLAGTVAALAVARLVVGDGRSGEGADANPPDAPGRAPTATSAGVPTVPAGLEGPVADAMRSFSARIQATADSLRQAHALPVELPEEWLGGYYLANAGEFPEIRQFWARYESLIHALRARDRAVFEAVVAEAAGAADLLDRNALAAYLTGRYEAAVSSRQVRYDQLVLASNRAMQFHDFLVSNQEELLFTPALGAAIPRDPVLELGTSTPALRAELNRRLDELLSALDRSRGSALPSSAGLARELLSGFGEL